MTEKPEGSVLTARRAAQHFRLSSADDACEHLYILTVRSSLGPSPPNAGRYTVASQFRCRSCERGYIFPRAPEQFVASPLCLVGYVRWDARSDRVPPLQTIIFSSFPGRTPVSRPFARNGLSGRGTGTPTVSSLCECDSAGDPLRPGKIEHSVWPPTLLAIKRVICPSRSRSHALESRQTQLCHR